MSVGAIDGGVKVILMRYVTVTLLKLAIVRGGRIGDAVPSSYGGGVSNFVSRRWIRNGGHGETKVEWLAGEYK